MTKPEHDDPIDFDRDLPTTPDDIRALREARRRAESVCLGSLRNLHLLEPPEWLARKLRATKARRKIEDWGTFEL